MRTLFKLTLATLVYFHSVSNAAPQLFLFLGGDSPRELTAIQPILNKPCISGVQIIYSWKKLEPEKGVYDFSQIEQDLRYMNSIHKKLFVQIQDRSFQPDVIPVPNYLRTDPIYNGGIAMQYDFPAEDKPLSAGWATRVWDPAVRKRFQLLLENLAKHFDGKIYGLNLPETSVDFDNNKLPKAYTPESYFAGEMENMAAAKKLFHHTIIIQYVNFFPGEWNNDHFFMSRLFAYAKQHHIGLGGPDAVPYQKNQMKNSYPFFHRYHNNIFPVAMAIQEPDYTYKKPGTNNYYQFSDFYSFTRDYLGANIIFWNVQEPFLSHELLPELNKGNKFSCEKDN